LGGVHKNAPISVLSISPTGNMFVVSPGEILPEVIAAPVPTAVIAGISPLDA